MKQTYFGILKCVISQDVYKELYKQNSRNQRDKY